VGADPLCNDPSAHMWFRLRMYVGDRALPQMTDLVGVRTWQPAANDAVTTAKITVRCYSIFKKNLPFTPLP
jgi:hypothetical protein